MPVLINQAQLKATRRAGLFLTRELIESEDGSIVPAQTLVQDRLRTAAHHSMNPLSAMIRADMSEPDEPGVYVGLWNNDTTFMPLSLVEAA